VPREDEFGIDFALHRPEVDLQPLVGAIDKTASPDGVRSAHEGEFPIPRMRNLQTSPDGFVEGFKLIQAGCQGTPAPWV
jgi:hypothetical protein